MLIHHFAAIVERYGRSRFPEQETIFSQKMGEEHAVPVFVSNFPNKMANLLTLIQMFGVTQSPPMRAQSTTQCFLRLTQVVGSPALTDRKLGQCCVGSLLGGVPSDLYRGFELTA
jgi:hypothetical protein